MFQIPRLFIAFRTLRCLLELTRLPPQSFFSRNSYPVVPQSYISTQSQAAENNCESVTGELVLRKGKSEGASNNISSIPSPTK
jgi:hypothetical protein